MVGLQNPPPCLVGRQNLERACQILIDEHHGGSVVEFSTVIRSREERHHLTVLSEEFVTILHHLVCTHDQVEIMGPQKFLHHVRSEHVRHAAVTFGPAHHVLVRVAPQKVTEQP